MLLLALLVAPLAGFAACVAMNAVLPGSMIYVAGVLTAPALTVWRGRRTRCSTSRTWRLAALSTAVALFLVAAALFVLFALMSAALSDFG